MLATMSQAKSEPHPFEAFTNFMRKLVSVPKQELDALRGRETAKKKRAKKKPAR